MWYTMRMHHITHAMQCNAMQCMNEEIKCVVMLIADTTQCNETDVETMQKNECVFAIPFDAECVITPRDSNLKEYVYDRTLPDFLKTDTGMICFSIGH